MPEKILALLENGSMTEWQIAEKLDISTDEVKACMTYLQNMHFIKSSVMNATGACGDSATIAPALLRLWQFLFFCFRFYLYDLEII